MNDYIAELENKIAEKDRAIVNLIEKLERAERTLHMRERQIVSLGKQISSLKGERRQLKRAGRADPSQKRK